MNLDLRVIPGAIKVEHAHAVVHDGGFGLFLDLHEKHVAVIAHTESPGRVILFADEGTLRDGKPIFLPAEPRATEIEIPGDWFIEASASRYTCRIIGVRKGSLIDVPIELATERSG